MPKPKNDQIGDCICPVGGCARVMKIFKFRGRENEKQRRLAGKLYGYCDEHGRFGADGKPAAQNYLLEGNLWDAKEKAAHAAKPAPKSDELPAPASKAPPPPPKESPPPPSTEPAKRPNVWDMA